MDAEREWFRAHIRWAVMAEGKEGLRQWEDSIYFFVSTNWDAAFQKALEIGHRRESSHAEGRRWVERRLAQIVTLHDMGADQTEFEVSLGSQKPTRGLSFDHVFNPQNAAPKPAF